MATTPPPKPANPARWRFLQATTLTGAAIAGLFMIQLAAASRDLPREAKQANRTSLAARLVPTGPVFKAPASAASRPTSAPATRPAPERNVETAENRERETEEIDESQVLLASDLISKSFLPVAAPSGVPAASEGGELLHDIRPSTLVPAATAAPLPHGFKSRRRAERVLRLQATAYCPCPKCCGSKAEGVTASGLPVTYNDGAFAAADTAVLPFGTKLIIPGYAAGRPVEVIDRGGAIKGMRVDVFFPTHEQARAWGRRWVNVTVVE